MRRRGVLRLAREARLHGLYLVTTDAGRPVHLAIAGDPRRRYWAMQAASLVPLRLHRAWWVAGKAISARVKRGFRARFAARRIRGNWFDMDAAEAERGVVALLEELGAWAASDADLAAVIDGG